MYDARFQLLTQNQQQDTGAEGLTAVRRRHEQVARVDWAVVLRLANPVKQHIALDAVAVDEGVVEVYTSARSVVGHVILERGAA